MSRQHFVFSDDCGLVNERTRIIRILIAMIDGRAHTTASAYRTQDRRTVKFLYVFHPIKGHSILFDKSAAIRTFVKDIPFRCFTRLTSVSHQADTSEPTLQRRIRRLERTNKEGRKATLGDMISGKPICYAELERAEEVHKT